MTIQLHLRQPSFLDFCPLTAAVEELANAGVAEQKGAVYTRREVVDFILDLVGYRADQPLHTLRLLEPSFGAGDFLFPAIERLLTAWKASEDRQSPLEALSDCIRAVELHRDTFHRTHSALLALLSGAGIQPRAAAAIAVRWLQHGDYLLTELSGEFDAVVGNPPYVRQEMIPQVLLAEYRARYTTVYDRADLYVPFIERSLQILRPGGTLGFICADRWMKNRYGGPLRALVAQDYHLKVHVDMTGTAAFHSDVVAYPAITIITREAPGPTRVASRPAITQATLTQLAAALSSASLPNPAQGVREVSNVTAGDEPWVLTSSQHLDLVRRLEAEFPGIEEAGCKIGIGVATGADRAFIAPFDELDVEEDRKEPLVMTRDLVGGHVQWRGFGVINPFSDQGGLVDLGRYPKLKRYLEAHKDVIARRHCARKTPGAWYRTIDRITPSLTRQPKLLIPDIKGQAQVVHDEGRFYPHHNLYFVTSIEWDLRALQAVLMSAVARLFVATYSTHMRGGFLRFQAQYLRRIRLPLWSDVPVLTRDRLIAAGQLQDLAACNCATFDLFELTEAERAAVRVES